MSRRGRRCLVWGIAGLGPLLAGARLVRAETPPAHESRPPNIVFLLTDDQRADTIAALGNPAIRTPHLDRLARNGFAFRNAYCLGGNSPAVCLPSRNMLLSGRSYFRFGQYAEADRPNLPASLNALGYDTYHHGKLGNSAREIHKVFHESRYLDDETDRTGGEPAKAVIDGAIAFLRARDYDRPFFLYLAFANPHDPRVAPARSQSIYDRNRIPLPVNFLPYHPFDNGELLVRDEKLAPWPRTPEIVRKELHDYYAVISALDEQIGRLLQVLTELGEFDRTLVVFTSDHGLAMGSHGLFGKQNLYEDGMKVPMILSGPGIPAGRSDAFVYLLDLFPTLCDLVGAPVPQGLDGVSFGPILRGERDTIRDTIYLAYREVQRAVRKDRWKLIRYPAVDVTQLFDLKNDPYEQINLAAHPRHAQRVKELMETLRVEQKRYGDDASLVIDRPRPAYVDLDDFPMAVDNAR